MLGQVAAWFLPSEMVLLIYVGKTLDPACREVGSGDGSGIHSQEALSLHWGKEAGFFQ